MNKGKTSSAAGVIDPKERVQALVDQVDEGYGKALIEQLMQRLLGLDVPYAVYEIYVVCVAVMFDQRCVPVYHMQGFLFLAIFFVIDDWRYYDAYVV